MDAVGELEFVKVDEEADGNIEELHVAQELRFVDGQDLLDGLGFDEDAAFNEEVESEGFLTRCPLVVDRDGFLRRAGEVSEFHFPHQAPLVDRLEESGTLVTMYLDGPADDDLGEG